MEIADLFVINKADLDGVRKLKRLLRELVMMTATEDHMVEIVKTITTQNEGIDELWEKIKKHHDYLYSTQEGKRKRNAQFELEVYELIREEIWREVKTFIEHDHDNLPAMESNNDPYKQAKDLLVKWKEAKKIE